MEKETLVREVHHRIKNNIAQIESLLSLRASATDSADVKAALREAISSVGSFRLLYEKLLVGEGYQDIAMKEYADGLIDSLVAVYGDRSNVTVEKRIEDFRISSKKAVPVGIILSELLTNVFKYAFGEGEEGRVVVDLSRIDARVTLVVQDNGVGLDAGFDSAESSGFGLNIVRMLAEQVDGTLAIEGENGTKAVLTFEI